MDVILERAKASPPQRGIALKQALVDFVLAAEGPLAESLEAYSANKLAVISKGQLPIARPTELVIDTFITEGKVGDRTVLEIFAQSQPELSTSDRQLLSEWQRSFIGLFAIKDLMPDRLQVMNWLTAKDYQVYFLDNQEKSQRSRYQVDDILVTQISPLTEQLWMISAPITFMGKLGKPKLAVAIGNFKQTFKDHLYSDAPELLAEAWRSVERYHQNFIDFFGTDELTVPGYQLEKQLSQFQQQISEQQFAAAGIDSSKSLQELTAEAGISQAEIAETAATMGVDGRAVEKLLQGPKATQMVTPQITLPEPIRKAAEVTALSHPHWGQMLLPTYSQFKKLLQSETPDNIPQVEKLAREYLQNPEMNAYIWQRLAREYPVQLEIVLRTTLERPDFQLAQDLEPLLRQFHKPLHPELPEIASVPLHLHTLFQAAVKTLHQSKSKSKPKTKPVGFQN